MYIGNGINTGTTKYLLMSLEANINISLLLLCKDLRIFKQLYIQSWILGLLSSSVRHCMLIYSAYWLNKITAKKPLIAATRKHHGISALVVHVLWLDIAILTAALTIIAWYYVFCWNRRKKKGDSILENPSIPNPFPELCCSPFASVLSASLLPKATSRKKQVRFMNYYLTVSKLVKWKHEEKLSYILSYFSNNK